MFSLSGLALLTTVGALALAASGCQRTISEYDHLMSQSANQARPRQITGKWFAKGSTHGPYEAGTDTILEINADGTGVLRYQRRPLPANYEAEGDVYPFNWAYRGNGFWIFAQKATTSASPLKGGFRLSQGYLLRETYVDTATSKETVQNRQIFIPLDKLPSRSQEPPSSRTP